MNPSEYVYTVYTELTNDFNNFLRNHEGSELGFISFYEWLNQEIDFVVLNQHLTETKKCRCCSRHMKGMLETNELHTVDEEGVPVIGPIEAYLSDTPCECPCRHFGRMIIRALNMYMY